MKLNPKKCKEMYVKFMNNPNTVYMRPVCIGDQVVERVKMYKLLVVIKSEDLKLKTRVEHVIAKSSKRLYSLRLLKPASVKPEDVLKVYVCSIRSVLEYAAQVWQDIPDAIESIQRRALRIVFPELSYQQALNQANLPTLANRREFLCKKLMADMMSESHPISFLLPQTKTRSIPYKLRTIGNEKTITNT